jgi:hypothetical protein
MCDILKSQELADLKNKGLGDDWDPSESVYDDYTKYVLRHEGAMPLLTVKKLSDYNVQGMSIIIIDRE